VDSLPSEPPNGSPPKIRKEEEKEEGGGEGKGGGWRGRGGEVVILSPGWAHNKST